jgi:hypothetical protein
MARLHIFAEGITEQVFAHTVLRRHLAYFGVYLQKPVLTAHRKKKAQVHRGGGRHFFPMQNDIKRRLKEDSGADVYFSTMIDLYALYSDFPGRETADKLRHIPRDRVKFLEESWLRETSDSRFIPFIQLHEFEGYLFVDVTKFSEFFDSSSRGIRELQNVADSVTSPELIDDGQHSAPSRRIIEEFPQYERLKSSVGPQMAELIGLAKIRSVCPHFDAWIGRLEQLGNG